MFDSLFSKSQPQPPKNHHEVLFPIRASIIEDPILASEIHASFSKNPLAEVLLDPAGRRSMKFNPSNIDGQPKYSLGYVNCTGIIAIGKSKQSGENISFISHDYLPSIIQTASMGHIDIIRNSHTPPTKEEVVRTYLLNTFNKDMKSMLESFKVQTEETTRDILLIGGNAKGNKSFLKSKTWTGYEDAIKNYSHVVQEVFQFSPIVITGPQKEESTCIYLDTKERRLHITRQEDLSDTKRNESYYPEELEEKKKHW